MRSSSDWIAQYEKMNALWFHDGAADRPHARLTSKIKVKTPDGEEEEEAHSNGFFNSGLVGENPVLLDEAASDLLTLLVKHGAPIAEVDRVVGPAMGAICIAHDLARHIGRANGRPCLSGYTEKESEDEKSVVVFKRTVIKPGDRVLVVEDVITTRSSMERTETAVRNAGGIVSPFRATLVNRSGREDADVVALINRSMETWPASQCPLCKKGSTALRPKDARNWELLNAEY